MVDPFEINDEMQELTERLLPSWRDVCDEYHIRAEELFAAQLEEGMGKKILREILEDKSHISHSDQWYGALGVSKWYFLLLSPLLRELFHPPLLPPFQSCSSPHLLLLALTDPPPSLTHASFSRS
jgi:hypothetical protein